MDWRRRCAERPYSAAAALFSFIAAGFMFASIPTHSTTLRVSGLVVIAAAIVASFMALFGPGGDYRRRPRI